MLIYILDACALLALFNEEAGASIVADLIKRNDSGEIPLFINVIQLLEVYYDRIRVMGHKYADNFLNQTYNSRLTIVDTIPQPFIQEAGRFKTSYHISLADAIACATAACLSGTLVTADHHELDTIASHEAIPFLWIR